jgi:hypothetical protein
VWRRSPDVEDSDAVIYVEGQDDKDQSDTSKASTTSKPNGIVSSSRTPPSDSPNAVSEDMPTTNSIIAESIASSEDEESGISNMIDDKAEETDAENDDENQANHSDHNALEDDDESDDGARTGGTVDKVAAAWRAVFESATCYMRFTDLN